MKSTWERITGRWRRTSTLNRNKLGHYAYGSLGDHNMKKDLLERALKIQEKHFGERITLTNLSNA